MHQGVETRQKSISNNTLLLVEPTTRRGNFKTKLISRGGKKRSRTPSRSVSFNSKVKEFYTLPLEEYTDSEHFATWYYDEEYELMMGQCLKIIKKLHQGKTISRKYCVRGLEGMTPAAADEKDFIRAETVIAVLEAQSRQTSLGYNDPDTIAQIYSFVAAKSCQVKATFVGQ